MTPKVRVAVDIGGTFTDVVIENGATRHVSKILTDVTLPEEGVLRAVAQALDKAGLNGRDVGLVVHGTTLATNALIERNGARTALLTTEGFRDTLEIAYEHRYAQYDIAAERAPPLVPRPLRYTVPERIDAAGAVRLALDEAALRAVCANMRDANIESVAIGFLHSYANPVHERRAEEILRAELPEVAITLSSSVCPEMREYERFTTAVANAYVQPLMAGYLGRLVNKLGTLGISCPLLLMTSGGGLTTVDIAIRFPVRLVESGPAGGAILAAQVARQCGADHVMSFDMGGTTAKICFIEQGTPATGHVFEIDRRYKFMKGSGFPVRIPVIEMVEIGAGGGSIAHVDTLGRLAVGPRSAGSTPGPACYGRGGEAPTVTDTNLIQGRIIPRYFAAGSLPLQTRAAEQAVATHLATPLGLDVPEAAHAVAEIVDENMANAARMHAAELGLDTTAHTMIAFGGSAPLHAARLAEKLSINRIIIPLGAGVGSACGFLCAPVAFNAVRTILWRPAQDPLETLNTVLEEMQAEAASIVALGAPHTEVDVLVRAEMRYTGQGHDIAVSLPGTHLAVTDTPALRHAFESAYNASFGLLLPHLDIEIRGVSVTVTARSTHTPHPTSYHDTNQHAPGIADTTHPAYNAQKQRFEAIPTVSRWALKTGDHKAGPLLVIEDETTTYVPLGFSISVLPTRDLELKRHITRHIGENTPTPQPLAERR